jgi:hypothetical protein
MGDRPSTILEVGGWQHEISDEICLVHEVVTAAALASGLGGETWP